MTAGGTPVLYGASYSVYTRIARPAFEEKGVPYRLVETDVFAAEGPPAEHLERHPFGRIPVLDHDGFNLYETVSMARYADEAFPGPPLQPGSAASRARMTQVISLLDSYAYQATVWDVYVERTLAGEEGRTPDEGRVAAGLARSAIVLGELEKMIGAHAFLVGDDVTLADLHAAPMIAYFRIAPEGAEVLSRHTRLTGWWEGMNRRPSLQRTAFARGGRRARLGGRRFCCYRRCGKMTVVAGEGRCRSTDG